MKKIDMGDQQHENSSNFTNMNGDNLAMVIKQLNLDKEIISHHGYFHRI